MTTYQNGGPIDGWNDCPPLALKKGNRSTSSSISRRRRAVSHDLNTLAKNSANNSSNSLLNSGSSIVAVPPPPTPSIPKQTLTLKGSISSNSIYTPKESVGSFSDSVAYNDENNREEFVAEPLKEKVEKLLSLPTFLGHKEFDYYKLKLQSLAASIISSEYNHVLEKSISMVLSERDITGAKELLLGFVLSHDGVSSWAVPLRKVLENVDFQSLHEHY